MAFVKNNRKWIVLALISIIIIVGIIWFFNQKKVDSITIDVDNTNSYNVKVSMGPNYSTVIYGNNTSKINFSISSIGVNVTAFLNKLKNF